MFLMPFEKPQERQSARVRQNLPIKVDQSTFRKNKNNKIKTKRNKINTFEKPKQQN